MQRLVWVLAFVIAAAMPAAVVLRRDSPYRAAGPQIAGPYSLSLLTDPRPTGDGTPGGRFWVLIEPRRDGVVPPATRARVAIRPLDREAPFVEAQAEPVGGDVTRQYAELVMDREAPFAVRVVVDGPWGSGAVGARVSATRERRLPRRLVAASGLPFLAVAFLWTIWWFRRRSG